MQRAFSLKNWYTLQEATERLSYSLNHKLEKTYMMDAVLEEHINLYWRALNNYAIEIDENGESEGEAMLLKDGAYEVALEKNIELKESIVDEVKSGDKRCLPIGGGFFIRNKKEQALEVLEKRSSSFPFNENEFEKMFFLPQLSSFGFTKESLEEFENKLLETPKVKNTSSHTKEKETLLKMVIGMAVKGYAYDPKQRRSNTVSEIQSDLDLLGIRLDKDTIRKWLKEATNFLPKQD